MANKQISNKYKVMSWRALSWGPTLAGVVREGFPEEVTCEQRSEKRQQSSHENLGVSPAVSPRMRQRPCLFRPSPGAGPKTPGTEQASDVQCGKDERYLMREAALQHAVPGDLTQVARAQLPHWGTRGLLPEVGHRTCSTCGAHKDLRLL